MSKKELERRQREEQEATAHAFQEFIKTFQDTSGPPNKLFVRAGILNANTGKEDETKFGQIYNPPVLMKPNSNTLKNAIECARLIKENKIEKPRCGEKPKSNLELLKEELRIRHLERDARNKLTKELENTNSFANFNESTDLTTTNLFVANLSPKLTEQDLMHIFGAYGPLGSVKIMWPRSDDKNRSSTNCGFVAYMSRKDGERALQGLKNREDMRIGWGKPVELPTHPIYIPPVLIKLLLPPPPPYTGLPFNAQPINSNYKTYTNEKELQELLYNSVVKVTIPLDKKILTLIHHTIEYVVNEGPMFEAILMNNEMNNPQYQFLFDNKSANHIYYRWKMFSILQGDSLTNWSTKSFRMFKGGSIWIPPLIPNYTEGMPESLINKPTVNKNLLSDAQKSRLIEHIQQLTTKRLKIAEALIFCMNHGEACKDIVEIIYSSFENESTKPVKKVARLYLVSDILYNAGLKKLIQFGFREAFKQYLPSIFEQLHKTYESLESFIVDKEALKTRVLNVLQAWDLWKVYEIEFINKLENCFLRRTDYHSHEEDSGVDEPLDGNNLIKRSLQNYNNNSPSKNDCVIINKEPVIKKEENIDEKQLFLMQGFIPSKWETIDPEQVEAQAMSTKKIFDLELESQIVKNREQEKAKMLDEEREKLREIELLTLKYQDELESGKQQLKKGHTIESQINDFRSHLMKKRNLNKEEKANTSSPYSSDSSPDDRKSSKNKEHFHKSRGGSKKKYKKDKYSKHSRNH